MGRVPPSTYSLFLVLLILVFLAGLYVVHRLQAGATEDIEPATPAELLKEFERAFYSGEMEKDEFERVSQALLAKEAEAGRVPPVVPPPPVPRDDSC